jgi:two-component system cell cycle response regulator DivK
MKVLIVEDNNDYRDVVEFFLKLKGFETIIAVNGREAVDLAESEKPQMILMDLNLPVLDGWEATRLIARNESTADIPILAVSANCSEELSAEVLKAGAVGCVQKPVDIESLPDLILNYALNEESGAVGSI